MGVGSDTGAPAPSRDTLGAVAAIALCSLLLCGVALWNRFPLVYPDTSVYLFDAVQIWNGGTPRGRRSIFYSLLPALLGANRSLWPVVVFQSLCVASVAYLTLRVFLGRRAPWALLALAPILAFASSASWYTAYVMPDIFTPVLVLGLFLLAVGPPDSSLATRLLLSVLVAGGIATHVANLPLAAGIVLAAALARGLLLRVAPTRAAPARSLAWMALPVGLAVVVTLAGNRMLTGRAALVARPYPHLVARLIADGTGRDVLRERCPEAGWALCDYTETLGTTPNQILWRPRSPFRDPDVLPRIEREEREIVRATLTTYPIRQLAITLQGVLRQLVRFQIEVYPQEVTGRHTSCEKKFSHYYCDGATRYVGSRQAADDLPLGPANRVQTAVVLASLVLAALCLPGLWHRGEAGNRALALVAIVALAVLGNAIITGALSQQTGRYGARVIWLLPVAALVAAAVVRSREPARVR